MDQRVFSLRSLVLLRRADGAQLLELALSLPILLVLMIGIFDFGGAWNLKQVLTNATREGARIGESENTQDLSSSGCPSPSAQCPCSVQAVADAVVRYLNNAGVNASCISPGTPTSSDTSTWTWSYSCANGTSLTINRGFRLTNPSGSPILATKVDLTCPYTWNLNRIIGLLPGHSTITLPSTITTSGIMD
jgi:Flp pilus assembly protein TadG